MTTTTGYPLRTGQLRRAGALMKVPRMVMAAILWLLLIESLPSVAAWGVLAVVVGGTVTAVVAERAIVRLLWWAHRPSTPVHMPGDPQVRVLITRRRVAGIGWAGRQHLIVPAGWVGRADLPAHLREARMRQVVSAGSFDVVYEWFTWPWQTLGSFVEGVARCLSWLPLIGFAWRVRLVVAGIAVWQTIVAGQLVSTAGIVVVIGLSYLLPWTKDHQERLVRQARADVERPLVAPVTTRPATFSAQPELGNGGRRSCTGERREDRPCGQWRSSSQFVTCTDEGIRGRAHRHKTTGRQGFES